MIDNRIFVSSSVIKESFRQTCEISPLVLYFIQKKIREDAVNRKQLQSDVKINKHISNGERFHEKYFSLLRNGLEKDKRDMVSFRMLELTNGSREIIIEPTIFSEELGMVGEPDVIVFSKNSEKVLELKNKSFYEGSELDKIQVQTYMTILENKDAKIIRDIHTAPSDVKKNHKKVKGFVLYRDGKLMPVSLKDKELIKSKTSEILEDIGNYNSIFDLPKPTNCDAYCINAMHCIKRNGVRHENIFASPGGFEIESPLYGARA